MIQGIEPFKVKDCALIAVSTSKRAQNLRELRDGIASVHSESIYYHFLGALLRPRTTDPQLGNDFALWTSDCLGDEEMAEDLASIDPTETCNAEALRKKLIEVIEKRLAESRGNPSAGTNHKFHFVRSQVVVFDTQREAITPQALPRLLPKFSPGTMFYHFIDARWRNPESVDDFQPWIERFGNHYSGLIRELASVQPYFVDLEELRDQLTTKVTHYFAEKGV
jgi:hypothetical protein